MLRVHTLSLVVFALVLTLACTMMSVTAQSDRSGSQGSGTDRDGSFPLFKSPREPIDSFLSVGDWGDHSTEATQVAAAMALVADTLNISMVLGLGDNFYFRGVQSEDDPRFQLLFERRYSQNSLQVPWLMILGNHDHHGDVTAQIRYSQRSSRWSLPSLSYSKLFQVNGNKTLQLIAVDSQYLHEGKQWQWLEDELIASSLADYLIVMCHHTVFSAGVYGTRFLKQLPALLEKYQVSLHLAGHDHTLQHHEWRGVHYLVNGGGFNAYGLPNRELVKQQLKWAQSSSGFMSHRFSPDGSELITTVYDDSARVLHTFAIQPRNIHPHNNSNNDNNHDHTEARAEL